MRAVVLQHERHEGGGLLAPALEQAGFALTTRLRGVASDDAAADLVVVLGGPMGACDDADHPFLADELALLRARLAADAPCVGICLGAQLLARAAGARVRRGTAGLEIGALPIEWSDAGCADPVTGDGARQLVVAHWHQDTFDPVPGAVPLARSARYEQQAFRLGRSYAFQFHVELDAAEFRRWLHRGVVELTAAGIDPRDLHDLHALEADGARRAALLARLAAACAAHAAAGRG